MEYLPNNTLSVHGRCVHDAMGGEIREVVVTAGRDFVGIGIVTGLALVPVVAAGCGRSPAPVEASFEDQRPPNIVWIVADELRPPFGGHIETLASAGVSFTMTSSVTREPALARSALLTGMQPTTLGLTKGGLSTPPPAGVTVLPEQLRRAGYYTSRAGPARHNLSVGTAVAAEDADADLGQPGLLGAWSAAGPDADWPGRGEDWDYPCTVSFGCGGAAAGDRSPFFAMFDVDASDGQALDARVGRILAALDADGLTDDTALFLLGLQGPAVQLIVRWPGRLRAGTTRDDPMRVIDIAATTLALAGVPVPRYMEGGVLPGLGARAHTTHDDPVVAATAELGERPVSDRLPPTAATPEGYPTGGLFHVAPRVDLWCDTKGSSIIYTTEREAPYRWRLYEGPFRMRFWTLRAQCGRLGYRDSAVVTYDFDIE